MIQYPRYSILNSLKCDLLALTLSPCSPTSLSCDKTFSRCSRCSSNVEHDITNKSSMYTWTYSKSGKSLKHALLKDVGTITKTHWKMLVFILAPKCDDCTQSFTKGHQFNMIIAHIKIEGCSMLKPFQFQ